MIDFPVFYVRQPPYGVSGSVLALGWSARVTRRRRDVSKSRLGLVCLAGANVPLS
jgi:hypothetical protein